MSAEQIFWHVQQPQYWPSQAAWDSINAGGSVADLKRRIEELEQRVGDLEARVP